MIQFFRKIRQKLLTENPPDQSSRAGKFSPPEQRSRAGKYLIYIIGEIILIVIGILIALSINNLNVDRINQEKEIKALKDLKIEFNTNKLKLDHIHKSAGNSKANMTEFKQYLKNTPYFLSSTFTYDELQQNHTSPAGLRTFNPVNSVLNSLINAGDINLIQNDSLKYLLTSWKDLATDFTEDNELYLDWYNTSYYSYMKNIPPLDESFFQIIGGREKLLKIYVDLYTDYKYWELINFAEFNSSEKESGAEDLLENLHMILKLIDFEISRKAPDDTNFE